MNKYLKNILIVCALMAFSIPFMALAETYTIPNPFGEDSSIWDIIGRVINFLYYIAIIAGTFAIIYSGYLFLFSAGDPLKVSTAKKLILYALIGIVVVFLSRGIINLLLKNVLGTSIQIK
jgi:heme A synthase